MFCHLDMDCFFASVEMRERPELRHKPLAVGGGTQRGVITTCNYPARAKGVRSAMPGFMARGICPDLIFLPVRLSLYQEESCQVFDLLASQSSEIERASIDEAYFRAPADPREAWDFCARIRERILAQLGLSCSIGIAPNKMLAKLMSSHRKPDAQLMMREEQVEAFMQTLDVGRIPGVGPKTQERFRQAGISTCGDLQKLSVEELASGWGHGGLVLYEKCRGVDRRDIQVSHERKSISVERTFSRNISSEDVLIDHLRALYLDFRKRLKPNVAHEQKIAKIFVRLKFSDFTRNSREAAAESLDLEAFEALAREAYRRHPGDLRLIGLGLRFDVPRERPQDPRQLSLWGWAS
jgi:DNA polymerase IV